jgi:NADH dehydrogenase FAD-containing subunit
LNFTIALYKKSNNPPRATAIRIGFVKGKNQRKINPPKPQAPANTTVCEILSHFKAGDNRLLSEAGSVGFLLWRSVYVVKQVSPRTRFLVLFDWLKTKLFGRDITDW